MEVNCLTSARQKIGLSTSKTHICGWGVVHVSLRSASQLAVIRQCFQRSIFLVSPMFFNLLCIWYRYKVTWLCHLILALVRCLEIPNNSLPFFVWVLCIVHDFIHSLSLRIVAWKQLVSLCLKPDLTFHSWTNIHNLSSSCISKGADATTELALFTF